jgi:acyl-CoA reductase-like NAD-dependent aldehyde dehydrogenase
VVNVVTGSGAALGDQIVSHPSVNKIAFTGSTEVGQHVASLAGQHLKPVTAELGGNAANIVFADADVEKAIGAVISAFVFNTGQFCMGGPRLLVERPLYETVLGILGQAVPGVPLGDPLKPETVIGPLSSKVQFDKVSGIVEGAIARGAKVVAGGKPIDLNGGYFFEATVLADLPNDDTAVAEEIFGPVLTVQPFDTEEEAIQMANSTPYGLAAGLQTTNIARAHRVSAALDAGIVWVNAWALLDPAIPFGGVKASGWGREYGPESLEAYTRTKSVVISTEG